MFETYFGLIEAAFVFGLAIAFFVWQWLDLRRYARQDQEQKKAKPPEADDPPDA